jgi:hypothetical protein
MKLAKYPIAILSAALFTVLLITPISSVSNLLWLSSVDMPVNVTSSLEVILYDFQRLGLPLYGVVIIGFAIAFLVSGLISKFTSLGGKYLYALAGSVAIGVALFLMVELLFQSELLGGNRTLIGKILHWLAGFIGGYFYYFLITKERSYTFVIRYFSVLYSYLLLGTVLDWIFNPAAAASGFGFVLSDLSNEGQNALIRDFTSFFLATTLFSLIGAIFLNPAWFYSIAIIYFGAAIFNLNAMSTYATGYNTIYISEIILGLWPLLIGLTIYFKAIRE